MAPWVDLMVAATSGSRGAGPVVMLHEAQRWMPLVEQLSTVAWLHPRDMCCNDFSSHPQRQPACRLRLNLHTQAEAAQQLLSRASLVVASVPDGAEPPQPWPDAWLPAALGAGSRVVFGRADAPAWLQPAWSAMVEGLVALAAPAGWSLRVSADVAEALASLGLSQTGFRQGFAQALVQNLAKRADVHLDTTAAPDSLRLRVRVPAVACIGTVSEAMVHHILVHNRALFGPRGGAGLLVPWDAATQLRLLMCNIRARVDGMTAAMGLQELWPQSTRYVEAGALVAFDLGPPEPGRDAWLQLSLPRAALPKDDFCEVGAVEFSSGLA